MPMPAKTTILALLLGLSSVYGLYATGVWVEERHFEDSPLAADARYDALPALLDGVSEAAFLTDETAPRQQGIRLFATRFGALPTNIVLLDMGQIIRKSKEGFSFVVDFTTPATMEEHIRGARGWADAEGLEVDVRRGPSGDLSVLHIKPRNAR